MYLWYVYQPTRSDKKQKKEKDDGGWKGKEGKGGEEGKAGPDKVDEPCPWCGCTGAQQLCVLSSRHGQYDEHVVFSFHSLRGGLQRARLDVRG